MFAYSYDIMYHCLTPIIVFNNNHLFAQSYWVSSIPNATVIISNIQLTNRFNPNKYYNSELGWKWEQWHSPELEPLNQFNVIHREWNSFSYSRKRNMFPIISFKMKYRFCKILYYWINQISDKTWYCFSDQNSLLMWL